MDSENVFKACDFKLQFTFAFYLWVLSILDYRKKKDQNELLLAGSLVPRLLSSLFGMTSHICWPLWRISSKIIRHLEWGRSDRE